MTQRTQVPQDAVDALQRGDLMTAFKVIRQQGGKVNMQAIGQVLEAHARAEAGRQGQRAGGAARPAGIEAVRHSHVQQEAGQAMRALLQKKPPPTVEMGDAPGGLRWLLVVLGLLALAAVLAFWG